jgi:hypothetical protein
VVTIAGENAGSCQWGGGTCPVQGDAGQQEQAAGSLAGGKASANRAQHLSALLLALMGE